MDTSVQERRVAHCIRQANDCYCVGVERTQWLRKNQELLGEEDSSDIKLDDGERQKEWARIYAGDSTDAPTMRRNCFETLCRFIKNVADSAEHSTGASGNKAKRKRKMTQLLQDSAEGGASCSMDNHCRDRVLFEAMLLLDRASTFRLESDESTLRLWALGALHHACMRAEQFSYCRRIESMFSAQSRTLAGVLHPLYTGINFNLKITHVYDLCEKLIDPFLLFARGDEHTYENPLRVTELTQMSAHEVHAQIVGARTEQSSSSSSMPAFCGRPLNELENVDTLYEYIRALLRHVVRAVLLDYSLVTARPMILCASIVFCVREYVCMPATDDYLHMLAQLDNHLSLTHPLLKLDGQFRWPEIHCPLIERVRTIVANSNDAREFCRI